MGESAAGSDWGALKADNSRSSIGAPAGWGGRRNPEGVTNGSELYLGPVEVVFEVPAAEGGGRGRGWLK